MVRDRDKRFAERIGEKLFLPSNTCWQNDIFVFYHLPQQITFLKQK